MNEQVEADIWNSAIDACLAIMATRWDDHNVAAEMKKLKK